MNFFKSKIEQPKEEKPKKEVNKSRRDFLFKKLPLVAGALAFAPELFAEDPVKKNKESIYKTVFDKERYDKDLEKYNQELENLRIFLNRYEITESMESKEIYKNNIVISVDLNINYNNGRDWKYKWQKRRSPEELGITVVYDGKKIDEADGTEYIKTTEKELSLKMKSDLVVLLFNAESDISKEIMEKIKDFGINSNENLLEDEESFEYIFPNINEDNHKLPKVGDTNISYNTIVYTKDNPRNINELFRLIPIGRTKYEFSRTYSNSNEEATRMENLIFSNLFQNGKSYLDKEIFSSKSGIFSNRLEIKEYGHRCIFLKGPIKKIIDNFSGTGASLSLWLDGEYRNINKFSSHTKYGQSVFLLPTPHVSKKPNEEDYKKIIKLKEKKDISINKTESEQKDKIAEPTTLQKSQVEVSPLDSCKFEPESKPYEIPTQAWKHGDISNTGVRIPPHNLDIQMGILKYPDGHEVDLTVRKYIELTKDLPEESKRKIFGNWWVEEIKKIKEN